MRARAWRARAPVKVDAHVALVQTRAVQVLDALLRVAAAAILDEAEAARRLLVLVKAHYDAVQRPALAEQLVDLLLGCVERQVAHVHCGGAPKARHVVLQAAVELAVLVLRQRLQALQEAAHRGGRRLTKELRARESAGTRERWHKRRRAGRTSSGAVARTFGCHVTSSELVRHHVVAAGLTTYNVRRAGRPRCASRKPR